MSNRGGSRYLGLKNERIQVCPNCGSSALVIYSNRNTRTRKTHLPYYCRNCDQGISKIINLQEFLLQKFNEAHGVTA
jgi:predicted RNA-binding Zn-ribbon protein involved in translation (DUF1610 family)